MRRLPGRDVGAALTSLLSALLQAYANVYFIPGPRFGLLFFAMTWLYPNIAFSGVSAALLGMAGARLMGLGAPVSSAVMTNCLLLGLAVGASYQLNPALILILVMATILTLFTTVVLVDYFWRLDKLSPMSLPFVVVAFLTAFAAQAYGSLHHYLEPLALQQWVLPEAMEAFFKAAGSAFFLPDVRAGLLVLMALFFASRYLFILALCGFATGQWVFTFLLGDSAPLVEHWAGFNFILTAIAVGGVYTIPGIYSFCLAMFAAALTALVTTAVQSFLVMHGLAVMALPFLMTSLLVLLALQKRQRLLAPYLNLEQPDLPERSLERFRLARSRGLCPQSTALNLPYMGCWQVYQSMDGQHTHQGMWRYAVDFFQLRSGQSYSGTGTRLEDYHCFGLPVVSPVSGQVALIENSVDDNLPGEVNIRQNWGNYVVIRLANGLFVLLAHLKRHSIEVEAGQWLIPGQMIAQCGNSGRSPQPHLHLHVQQGVVPGGQTHPFHFSHVFFEQDDDSRYSLNHIPVEAEGLLQPLHDPVLQKALHFAVGRRWRYRVNSAKAAASFERCLTVEMDVLGQFYLVSDTGARVKLVEFESGLALFDRSGPGDELLDAFILAMGYLPFCYSASNTRPLCWSSRTPVAVLPVTALKKGWLEFLSIFGLHVDSISTLHLDSSTTYQLQSHHQLRFGPMLPERELHCAETRVTIGESGVGRLQLLTGSGANRKVAFDLDAKLLSSEICSDLGVPQQAIAVESFESMTAASSRQPSLSGFGETRCEPVHGRSTDASLQQTVSKPEW